MPLIPKAKAPVRLTATVTPANHATLLSYATFLGEDIRTKASTRRAINRLINGAIELLAKDREFVQAQRPTKQGAAA
jgi:hypothetical protein